MDRLWWLMPGPSQFLSGVVEDIRDGRNAVLRFPKYAPNGFQSRLREELEGRDGWRWEYLRASQEECLSPVDLLFRVLAPDYPSDSLRSVKLLASQHSFQGRVIWIDDFSTANWPPWREFLEEYAQVCDALSVLERTIFVAFLSSEYSVPLPCEGPRLAHHNWREVTGNLDSALFAAFLVYQKNWATPKKRIAAATIAHVALWDSELAKELSDEPIESILLPLAFLENFANQRGWDNQSITDKEELWRHGIFERFDGVDKFHSAYLAISNRTEELQRRIWSGQIVVLMPLVEEKRQKILVDLKDSLKVPYRTRFGEEITDMLDLEIGHIESQITGFDSKVAPATQEKVKRLRRIRNHLSHLETVPLELILGDDLL
jgi:hypothetical protein